MPPHRPKIELMGGPKDGDRNHGAAKYDWQVTVWPNGEVAVRVEFHPDYWLLYRGYLNFAGGVTKIGFVDRMPVNLTPAQ